MYIRFVAALLINASLAIAATYYNCFLRKANRIKALQHMRENYASVEAVPVRTKRVHGIPGESSYNLRVGHITVWYEYTVDNRAYCRKYSFSDSGAVSVDYPQSLTFYYPPGDPKKGKCVEDMGIYNIAPGCLLTIVGFFASMFLLLWIFGVYG